MCDQKSISPGALSTICEELRHAVQRSGIEARMAREYLASDSRVMRGVGSRLGMYAGEHARDCIAAAEEIGETRRGLVAIYRCELVRGSNG